MISLSHVLAATEVIIRQRLEGPWNLFYDPRPTMKEFVREVKKHAGQRPRLFPISVQFATIAVKVALSIGLPIPADPGQIRALQLNEDSPWQSDLSILLPGREPEFQLSYALDQLKSQ